MSARLPLLAAACGITLLALAGCAAEPVASGPAPATTTAPATATAGASAGSTATAESTAASEATAPTRTAAADGCPVSAATLQKASRAPAGWRIDGKSIQCAEGWAQAGTIAPSPEKQGDGVTLFRFDRAGGRWVEVEEGSAIDCADRGIPRSAAGKLSVCYRPY